MGIGVLVFFYLFFMVSATTIVYMCRYFHDQRVIGNTIFYAIHVLTILFFLVQIFFYADILAENDLGLIIFAIVFVIVLVSSFGVFLFSFLEWRATDRHPIIAKVISCLVIMAVIFILLSLSYFYPIMGI